MARVRPHAKIHTSLQYHRKTAQTVWPDNDAMAAFCRLLVYGINQFAAKRGGEIRLNRTQLLDVTGKRRCDSAREVLAKLEKSGLLLVHSVGTLWTVTVLKFAEKQGIDAKNCSPREQKQKQKQNKTPLTPQSRVIPEEFTPLSDEQYRKLAASEATKANAVRLRAWSTGLHQAQIGPRVIRAWHELIYPKLRSRRVQRQYQAISQNWWPRAGLVELKAAYLQVLQERQAEAERERDVERRADQEDLPPIPGLVIHYAGEVPQGEVPQ